jgi:hypothetical protein
MEWKHELSVSFQQQPIRRQVSSTIGIVFVRHGTLHEKNEVDEPALCLYVTTIVVPPSNSSYFYQTSFKIPKTLNVILFIVDFDETEITYSLICYL